MGVEGHFCDQCGSRAYPGDKCCRGCGRPLAGAVRENGDTCAATEEGDVMAEAASAKGDVPGSMLTEEGRRVWKVRSPDGAIHGPYTSKQMVEAVIRGAIPLDWTARCGNGPVSKVRQAVGDDVVTKAQAARIVKRSPLQEQDAGAPKIFADDYFGPVGATPPTYTARTVRCPHCGEWSVTAERRSPTQARWAIGCLGLLIWPLWLLLLWQRDTVHYQCSSCGMEWTTDV